MAVSFPSEYHLSVFINCPFDHRYRKLFHAIIFTVCDCGYFARCAQEINDASQIRIQKIFQIISECRLGIHDISRTELDANSKLPRFNMPLELGIFLGAKAYGSKDQRNKACLIFDRERYRYQKFCSDIAGQDISGHGQSAETAIREVRDFLRGAGREMTMPGGAVIYQRYLAFCKQLPGLCYSTGLECKNIIFNDFTMLVAKWLKSNPNAL